MTDLTEEIIKRAFSSHLDSIVKDFSKELDKQTKHALQCAYRKLFEKAIRNACISPHEYETLYPSYMKSQYDPKDPNFQLIHRAVSDRLTEEIKKIEDRKREDDDIFSQAYEEEYKKAIITVAKHKARRDAFRKAMNNDK